MIRIFITAVMLFICLFMTACNSFEENAQTGIETGNKDSLSTSPKVNTYEDIKPDEALERIKNEKDIVLLDVRTPEEYAEKHIPDSILIPVDVIEERAPLELTNKEAVIFVYCRSGRRSVDASKALVEMGYTNVYNLGGIIDWPYDTESGFYNFEES